MRKSSIDYIDNVIAFMEHAIAGEPMIFFDLETTGLSRKFNRIISCSAIKYKYNAGKLEELGKLNLFINPGFHIPDEVSRINGITDEMVKDSPDEDDGFDDIYNFFGPHPLVAGYNSENFDQGFMEDMYQRASGKSFSPIMHLDVMKMAKEKLDTPSHKLSDVAEELGCDIGLTFHKSIDDVYATARVFKVLLGMYTSSDKPSSKTVKVRAFNYWAPNHLLERIYIYTLPKTKTYYDVYQKTWNSDENELNLDDIKQQVFRMANANNEKEFVLAAKKNDKINSIIRTGGKNVRRCRNNKSNA